MSWISPKGNDPISSILHQITEPVLGPIRRLMPQLGMFDLSAELIPSLFKIADNDCCEGSMLDIYLLLELFIFLN